MRRAGAARRERRPHRFIRALCKGIAKEMEAADWGSAAPRKILPTSGRPPTASLPTRRPRSSRRGRGYRRRTDAVTQRARSNGKAGDGADRGVRGRAGASPARCVLRRRSTPSSHSSSARIKPAAAALSGCTTRRSSGERRRHVLRASIVQKFGVPTMLDFRLKLSICHREIRKGSLHLELWRWSKPEQGTP